MTMRANKAVAVAAGLVALLLSSTAALAQTPTRISVGGDASVAEVPSTGANDGAVEMVTDFTAAPLPFTCTDVSISGSAERGAPVRAGSVIGHIDTLNFAECTMTDLDFPINGELSGMDIVATSAAAPHAPIPIKIANIDGRLHSTGAKPWTCSMRVINRVGIDLTGSLTPGSGSIDARLTISNANFALALTALDATTDAPTSSGTCGGQVYSGDNLNMGATFVLDTGGAGLIDHDDTAAISANDSARTAP